MRFRGKESVRNYNPEDSMRFISQIISILFLMTANANAEDTAPYETEEGSMQVTEADGDTTPPEYKLEACSFCLLPVSMDLNVGFDTFETATNIEALRINRFYELYRARCEGGPDTPPDPNLTASQCVEALDSVTSALAALERTKYEYNNLAATGNPETMGISRAARVGGPIFAEAEPPKQRATNTIPGLGDHPAEDLIAYDNNGMTLFGKWFFTYPTRVFQKIADAERANALLVDACVAGAEGWDNLFSHLKDRYIDLNTLSARGPLAISLGSTAARQSRVRTGYKPDKLAEFDARLIVIENIMKEAGGEKIESRGRSIAYFMRDARSPVGSQERRVSCMVLTNTLGEAEIYAWTLSAFAGVAAIDLCPDSDYFHTCSSYELLGGDLFVTLPISN